MHVVKMLFSPSAYGCSKIKNFHYRDRIPDMSHSHLVARVSLSFVLRVRRTTKVKFIYQLSVWPVLHKLVQFPGQRRANFYCRFVCSDIQHVRKLCGSSKIDDLVLCTFCHDANN